MTTPPSPPHAPTRPTNLAMLATIVAVVFALAFGLCSVSTFAVLRINHKLGFSLIRLSLVTEALCFFSLLLIGILALIRSIRAR